jgi:hypothetical protein
MKKVLFIAVLAVASLASCKKDRTCTCTFTSTDPTSVSSTQVYTIVDAKKGDAKKACITSTSVNGSYTDTETCKLN